MNKKDKEMYEQVMGKKLTKEELLECDKEAHKSYKEEDKEDFRNRMILILAILFVGLLGLYLLGALK
jgi:hypothetical protein